LVVTEHPNALLVRRLMAAFVAQDRATIEQVLDPDCVWRVPGDNGLAGVYEGLPAVMGLFRTLKRVFEGVPAFEVVDLTTSQDRAICLQYGVVMVGGRQVRFRECLVYRIQDNRVVEVEEFQQDQDGFNQAFSHEVVSRVMRS
jgi:ketosteroid isomerase-like protein